MAEGLRYATPLRAVDRVEVLNSPPPAVRLRAVKTVTAVDPYMAGHFPGLPMLPAVFLLEGLRQAAVKAVPTDRPLELLEVRSARLLAPMFGGDEITIEATLQPLDQAWLADTRCRRGDGTPMARLTALLGDPRSSVSDQPPAEVRPQPPAPATGPPVLDHAAVRALLPVRHPILLVDQVIAQSPGRWIESVKSITGAEPCYRGLAEGLPADAYAFPRSLILESFGQTAALLWLSRGDAGESGLLMLAAIRDCRFTGAAFPGDQLRHVARLDHLVGPNAFVHGEIWAGDRRLATIGTLIAVSRPVASPGR